MAASPPRPPQNLGNKNSTVSDSDVRHYPAFLWLRDRRLHFLLRPATKLANSAWFIRFDELRHSSLRTQLAGSPVHRTGLPGRNNGTDSPTRSSGFSQRGELRS